MIYPEKIIRNRETSEKMRKNHRNSCYFLKFADFMGKKMFKLTIVERIRHFK